jgi:hypothetical protein
MQSRPAQLHRYWMKKKKFERLRRIDDKALVSAFARHLTATMTIAAWIALSNHCVFASVAPKPQSTASACPFHSKPAKSQTPLGAVQCCKILRATVTVPAKIPTRAVVDLIHVDLAVTGTFVLGPAKTSFTGFAIGTGPPGTTSFLELVGSMRAHAPPLFA